MKMVPERVYVNSNVRDYVGQTAVRLGPVVYCAEEADNGPGLHLLRFPRSSRLTLTEGFAGYAAVEAEGSRICPKNGRLYGTDPADDSESVLIRLVPYCV